MGGVLVLFLGMVLGASLGWADEQPKGGTLTPDASFDQGIITKNSGNTIQINGTNYKVDPDIVVEDDEGRTRDLRELTPGVPVQFHLQKKKIDQLIWILPK